MAAVYLSESDVKSLVEMEDALEVVERAFFNLDAAQAQNMPRQRLRTENVMMHVLAGADRSVSQLGWKIYTTTRQEARFLVGIYDGGTGEMLAMMDADFLGQLRTGAASGVATNYLANPEASSLALIGSGTQARTQAWAIAKVRPIKIIRVYSRNKQHRAEFVRQLAEELSCQVLPVESSYQALIESEIVVTATTSKRQVFSGSDLRPGTHINAIGSNSIKKAELDLETFRRSSPIVCDSIEQCQNEAGDFVEPIAQGLIHWDQIRDLRQVVSGKVKREDPNQITLFKSVGLGLQDVALGHLVWQRAREKGLGTPLPF